MAPDYEIIGKRIKKERLKKNLTQEKMAEKLDTSTAYYSRIETGKTNINLKRIVEISDILETSVAYFITGSNETKQDYLDNEFAEILSKCTPKQKKFICKIAELVIQNV